MTVTQRQASLGSGTEQDGVVDTENTKKTTGNGDKREKQNVGTKSKENIMGGSKQAEDAKDKVTPRQNLFFTHPWSGMVESYLSSPHRVSTLRVEYADSDLRRALFQNWKRT